MTSVDETPCCYRRGLPSGSSTLRAHSAVIRPLVAWYLQYGLAITPSNGAPHVHLIQTQIRAILNNPAYGRGALCTRPDAHEWIHQIGGCLMGLFAELSDALEDQGERPLPLHLIDATPQREGLDAPQAD